MASANFTILPRTLAVGGINFSTAVCKVLLLAALPTEANLDAWAFRSDVTGEVAAGGGYAVGGVAQAFVLAALDATNNRQAITYTNLAPGWNPATFAAVGAIIYQDTALATTDKLLHLIDFGATITGAGAGYNLTYTSPFFINR